MGRSPCCDKSKVKRGTWSPEEDATLINYLNKHGTGGNWIALPQKAGLRRCGKSCRLRWLNYLRPDIKHGAFTQEEENIICSLYNRIGSRWSVIASQLPGRTDNDVKNYWNTKLKKKLMATTHSISTPNPPTHKSNIETATATTTMISDKTTIFRASTNPLTTFPEPFLTEIYEPINFNFPRFILEGSSNFSSVNIINSSPFSLSHQDSSPFRPFDLGMDENYGVTLDEDFGADSNDADLFSIFQGVSQRH